MAKGVAVKKKKWVSILAPAVFDFQELGESHVAAPEDLVGRNVSVSLMTLTGEPQRQSIHVKFKIVGMKDGKAATELVGLRMLASSAKKLVRRRRSKIADSFIVSLKDGTFVRIKPLVTTRGTVTSALLSDLRKRMRAYIAQYANKLDKDEFVRLVVQKKFQGGLARTLKKVHPMGPCDIREFLFVSKEQAKGKLRILPPKAPEKPSEPAEAVEKETAAAQA
ncbi:hypothetical protein D6825_01750 [Candidatus Woesearchaeota archaeon]|nr:MAG: hypothetical protein D6825_01750 [Candidatus Woesearchaeota archaeon]